MRFYGFAALVVAILNVLLALAFVAGTAWIVRWVFL